jgi:dolichyl-phosphate beta-glucosyltransferase
MWYVGFMKISVIMPAYNEGKIIKENAIKVDDFLAKEYKDYELIIVDDGSKDNTLEIIEEIAKKRKKIKVITYPFNRGKGAAVKAGVMAAAGDYILFTDSDLAYAPESLMDAASILQDFDIAIGSRYICGDRAKYKFKRKLISRIFIGYTNSMLGIKFSDIQAGIKGFKKEAAKDIFNKLTIFGFGFDAEVLALAKINKYSVGEFAVCVSGQRKSSKVRVLKDSFKMFFNVISVYWRIL